MPPPSRPGLGRLARRTWLRVLRRAFGADALTPDERAEIGEIGDEMGALDRAGASGERAGGLPPTALGEEEQLRRQAALDDIGAVVQGLADRTTDRLVEIFDRTDVAEGTAAAIEARAVPKTLAAELRRASDDLARDWDRVAVTKLQDAHNEGRARAIERQAPGDPEVYKQPSGDACVDCFRLHIGPDGAPRIFRLSALRAAGTNQGRRRADWRAVVGSTHPHCSCTVHPVPTGWGFDEAGDLAPGGERGVRYEGEPELAVALAAEDEIQKAALLGGEIEFQALTLRVNANAGDAQRWRAPATARRAAAPRYASAQLGPFEAYLGPDPTAPSAYVVEPGPDDARDRPLLYLGFRAPNDVEAAFWTHHPATPVRGLSQLSLDELRALLAVSQSAGRLGRDAGDAFARAMDVLRDERGWSPMSSGAGLAATERPHPRARPRTPAVPDERPLGDRPKARSRRIVPVVTLAPARAPSLGTAHPAPRPTPSDAEGRTATAERQAKQLALREEQRRRHARPAPAARVGSALPSQPNDLTSD